MIRLAHSWRSWVRFSRRCATSSGSRRSSPAGRPLPAGCPVSVDVIVLSSLVPARAVVSSRSHFVIVTVVPRPGSETMSNSSISRREPGSPSPRPPRYVL